MTEFGKRILCNPVLAVEWLTCGLHHSGAHMLMTQLQRISFLNLKDCYFTTPPSVSNI
jgi:hypothetical protein